METNDMYLNEYHRRQSKEVVRKVSEQPLMSLQECIEQAKRLREQPFHPVPKKNSVESGIARLVETSEAFTFLHDEEDLYTLDDLKERY